MEKTDGNQERPNHNGNRVEFSFPVIVSGDKKKLAKVSEVFSAQFAWHEGERDVIKVEIEDCSSKTFAYFINIIEGDMTFSAIHDVGSLGLPELFEMYYLVGKYQIDMEGFNKPLLKEINNIIINELNLPKIIEIIETYKGLTIFETICDNLKKRCAQFAWRYYCSVDDVFQVLDGKSDSNLIILLLKEMPWFKKNLCLNCCKLKGECKDGKVVDIARPGIRISSELTNSEGWIGEIITVVKEVYDSSGDTVNFTVSIKWDNYGYTQTITVRSGKTELIYHC